jgi:hypothetical protein
MLGSKFLDDNTFQNRSWSEVSGIAVRELNTLEHEWMDAINWHLYVDLDRSADYNAWLKSWKEWSDNRERQRLMAARERLAPIVSAVDTDLARSHANANSYANWHQQQIAEYERLSNLKRMEQAQQPGGFRSREPSWTYPQPSNAWNAPITPPDSGYVTPNYHNSAVAANAHYNEWFGQHNQIGNQQLGNQHFGRQPSHRYGQPAAITPSYHSRNSSGYHGNLHNGHNIWQHHPADCSCLDCATVRHNQQPYLGHGHAYGQPVMG